METQGLHVKEILLFLFNPTPVRGVYATPCRKMAITPKNNDPKEPKLRDFSYTKAAKKRDY